MARMTQNKQKALFSLFHCGPSTKNSRNVVVSSGVKIVIIIIIILVIVTKLIIATIK